MRMSALPALLAACLALMAPQAFAQQGGQGAQPQDTLRETFGSWEVRCIRGNNGAELCVMTQIGKGSEGNDVVEVRIRKVEGLKTPDGQEIPAAIQIATPLGVLLPAGVRLQIDGKEPRTAPYEVCGPQGCVVRQPLSNEFLAELKGGSNATVTVVAVPATEVKVNISLNGFTKAFNDIKP